MVRHLQAGRTGAGVATCRGLVTGLYAVRHTNSDGPLAHVPDFPWEAAADTVRAFVLAPRTKAQGDDTLAELPFLALVPEWSEILADVARRARAEVRRGDALP